MSLLRKRTRALIYGLAAGEALGYDRKPGAPIGEMTLSSLALAKEVARLGRIDEAELRRALLSGELEVPVLRRDRLDDAVAGAAAVLGAGIARRPQDYNGLVDDVVSVVALHRYTAPAVAGGCAFAAAIAALLDGWDMESAGSLAIAIAQRGSTFGRKEGRVSVADQIREVLARVDDLTVGKSGDLRRALAAIRTLPPLPRALGVAYACRDARLAVEEAAGLADHADFTGAIAGALCAAFRPESLPEAWRLGAARACGEQGLDPELIVDDLLSIRTSKWSPAIW